MDNLMNVGERNSSRSNKGMRVGTLSPNTAVPNAARIPTLITATAAAHEIPSVPKLLNHIFGESEKAGFFAYLRAINFKPLFA